MKTPSLLEQAKAFAQNNTTGVALRILPLAAASVVAPLAAEGASNVVFQPQNPTYTNNSRVSFTPIGQSGGTTTAGSTALAPFNGITGEKSFGHVDYFVNDNLAAITTSGPTASGLPGNFFQFNAVTVQGTTGSSGGVFQQGDAVPVKFNFTLSNSTEGLTIENWTLTFSINVGFSNGSGGGTANNSVSFNGTGIGTFSGFDFINIDNIGSGFGSGSSTPFNGYSAILNLTFSTDNTFSGGAFGIDIPMDSLDFNAIIPEPSTWWLLSCGTVLGGALALRQRRRQQQRAAVS